MKPFYLLLPFVLEICILENDMHVSSYQVQLECLEKSI